MPVWMLRSPRPTGGMPRTMRRCRAADVMPLSGNGCGARRPTGPRSRLPVTMVRGASWRHGSVSTSLRTQIGSRHQPARYGEPMPARMSSPSKRIADTATTCWTSCRSVRLRPAMPDRRGANTGCCPTAGGRSGSTSCAAHCGPGQPGSSIISSAWQTPCPKSRRSPASSLSPAPGASSPRLCENYRQL